MSRLERIELIVVHHSASSLATTAAQIRHWHVHGNGWDDIAYHAVVEADGEIVEGRDIQDLISGAHALGVNQKSLGICCVGDNRFKDSSWTQPQKESLRRWIHAALLIFGMEMEAVRGHRDVGKTRTECPGMTTAELHELLR